MKTLRFGMLLLVLTALPTVVSAQKKTPPPPSSSPEQCTIAFYDQDSIAIQLPQGKVHYDEIAAANKNLVKIRFALDTARDHWLRVKDDSVMSNTEAGRQTQTDALTEVVSLRADSLIEIMQMETAYEKLQPLYDRIHHAADSIAATMSIKHVFESGQNHPMTCPTDQLLMIDITNDISLAMGVKPNLLRIGTFNADSLMRLMPGYAQLADSTNEEMKNLNKALAEMDAEISKEQHELDSLRPGLSKNKIKLREKKIADLQDNRETYRGYESYKIDVRDSLRTTEYRRKFRTAVASAAKEQNCFRYYDESVARSYWSLKEAEFIDLNALIAQKLRL